MPRSRWLRPLPSFTEAFSAGNTETPESLVQHTLRQMERISLEAEYQRLRARIPGYSRDAHAQWLHRLITEKPSYER